MCSTIVLIGIIIVLTLLVPSIKAVEDFKIANPDKSAEVETLKTNLAKATKDLDAAIAAGGNEEQIKRLRKERDEAETKANEGVTKLQKDLEDFKKEVAGDTKNEMLDRLARGDAEIQRRGAGGLPGLR